MENTVIEYNKVAINDVKSELLQQLQSECITVNIRMMNLGLARDKAEEYAKMMDTLESNIREMMSQVVAMLSDVISAVDNVDSN